MRRDTHIFGEGHGVRRQVLVMQNDDITRRRHTRARQARRFHPAPPARQGQDERIGIVVTDGAVFKRLNIAAGGASPGSARRAGKAVDR